MSSRGTSMKGRPHSIYKLMPIVHWSKRLKNSYEKNGLILLHTLNFRLQIQIELRNVLVVLMIGTCTGISFSYHYLYWHCEDWSLKKAYELESAIEHAFLDNAWKLIYNVSCRKQWSLPFKDISASKQWGALIGGAVSSAGSIMHFGDMVLEMIRGIV